MDQNFGVEPPTIWDKMRGGVLELIEFIVIILALYAIIHFFIAEPHQVQGISMLPNFEDGDVVITNKLAPRLGQLQRGEVIILQYPNDTTKDYIKRIIGLPGERLKVQNDHVYINDQLLNEPYLDPSVKTTVRGYMPEGQDIVVPNDSYFVMGDNRENSSDSREWGPLQKHFVIGQAFIRYWPVTKFQYLEIGKSYKHS